MKKLLLLTTVFLFLTSCMKDDIIEVIDPVTEIPENLQIANIQGIKLESTIVSSEVRMNVKLPENGTYRIKIKNIERSLISQEKLSAHGGDNLLKVYVSSLDDDSYILELTDNEHNILGITTIVVKN